MTTVNHLLKAKGSRPKSVDPSVSVRAALGEMFHHSVGSLIVCDRGRFAGIFTERHFAAAVARQGPGCMDGRVGDLMDPDAVSVSPDDTIDDCMALMTAWRTRHLPVLDGGQVVGVVSIGDVVKELVTDKDFMIEQLERYIAGR